MRVETTPFIVVALVGVLSGFFASPVKAQTPSTSSLPVRSITISGAQISSDAYLDGAAFTQRASPLADIGLALFDTPEVALLCYSPWVPPSTWSLFAHLPLVDTPLAYYYPLTYSLGDWKYEYGDNLMCQLWDCDGGVGGCDPANPNVLPSAAAGDDLLSQASVSLGAFQLTGSALLNMTVPQGGKGTVGAPGGGVLLACAGCRQLLRDNPSWVNPFSAPPSSSGQTPDILSSPSPGTNYITSPSPATSLSPLPLAPPPPAPSPAVDSFEGPPAQEDPVAAPPVQEPQTSPPLDTLIVPPILPPSPPPEAPSPSPPIADPPASVSPTPPEEIKNDEDIILPPGPELVTKTSTMGKKTMIIVLSVLSALLAILLVALVAFFIIRRRGWKTVQPDVPASSVLKKGAARKVSNNSHLRIRVQRPADADAALRQHRVGGAIAEMPWAPKTRT